MNDAIKDKGDEEEVERKKGEGTMKEAGEIKE